VIQVQSNQRAFRRLKAALLAASVMGAGAPALAEEDPKGSADTVDAVVVTGKRVSPPLFESLELLGRDPSVVA
jgi:hypothetical protein